MSVSQPSSRQPPVVPVDRLQLHQTAREASLKHTNLQEIQGSIMGFADRYIAAMADVYDRAQRNATSLDVRLALQRWKILAGLGAASNAVDPNPVVGLMDMALMVTLTSQTLSEPWAAEFFGKEDLAIILTTLKAQEADIWRIAGSYLTGDQINELRQLAVRWREDHPDQRYVAGARLADFPESTRSNPPGGVPLVNSVFGLLTLDPFTGLDPAVKEVEQSRILAERLFFYLQHVPVMMTWQADALYLQILIEPQVQKLFGDMNTVAGSTTRFTEATSQFSEATSRVATSVERFRTRLPEQQATLVTQLDELIAKQRAAALDQATTQVSMQTSATIDQLNSTVATQQAAMAKNLQTVMDRSIDRLYERLRSLVLIAAGSILGALVIYRLVFARRAAKPPRN
jgi:hypothetical protein